MTVLLIASIESASLAAASLVVLALGTAASMTVLTAGFGLTLRRVQAQAAVDRIAPVLGLSTLSFGAWYGLAALSLVPWST